MRARSNVIDRLNILGLSEKTIKDDGFVSLLSPRISLNLISDCDLMPDQV